MPTRMVRNSNWWHGDYVIHSESNLIVEIDYLQQTTEWMSEAVDRLPTHRTSSRGFGPVYGTDGRIIREDIR